MTVEPSRPDELSSTTTAEPSTTTMTVEPSRPDELSSTTTAEPSTTTMTVEPSRPAEPLTEPSTTTSRPRTMMPGDYAKNLFAFAFALGATFSFAIFYYCLVLFVALQDTQQVIENCSELS
jgi:hypothetical protein